MLEDVLKTIDARKHQSLSALMEFLAIPSVSTKPEHKDDMLRAATWLSDQLRFAELEVAILPTKGHPVVVAKNRHQPGRPTILFYGHYDVQPPEPLELWTTPAFEPTVRKDDTGHDAVFARGAVDDKGQVWAHCEAIMAWQAHGGPPVNVTLVVEGEEEIGSTHFADFLRSHRAELRADICLVSDTAMPDRHTPAIDYGLRGIVYAEVTLTGPSHDLHSGTFGGAAPNPANALCAILGSLYDFSSGRVSIPGFYDDVREPTDDEKRLAAEVPFDEARWRREIGVTSAVGEQQYSLVERTTMRPTLDINGLTSGYQGAGAKTVIPSRASAKVSMRLVPDQDPHDVARIFESEVRRRVPAGFVIDVKFHSISPPCAVPTESSYLLTVAEVLRARFDRTPVLQRSGGIIHAVAMFRDILNIDTLLVGFGLPDDRLHSPNEKLDLALFYTAQSTIASIYSAIGEMKRSE